MELILKQDVENLGFKNDVISVKNGYGRNYLIPQGFAIMATPSARKQLQETLKQQAFKEQKLVDEAKKTAELLKATEIKIVTKAGGSGKLFGSINNADLADALDKQNLSIDRKFISIVGGSVKTTGTHTAAIRLHRNVIVDFPFEVIAEAN
jgi:large subunit ribosomal protein L9